MRVMTRQRWAWLFAVALWSCGGLTDPNGPRLDWVTGTGAVVGQKGLLTVIMRAPVSRDVEVALSVADPAIAAVPEKAVVRAGALFVELPYDGLAVGSTDVVARLGDVTDEVTLQVADAVRLDSVSTSSVRLQTGARTNLYVYLNISTPEPVAVQLSSSVPGVVTLPETLELGPGLRSAALPLTAGAVGTALVTVSLGGQVAYVSVAVTASAGLQTAYVTPSHALAGQTVWLDLRLFATPAADLPVTVHSSNPSVVADLPAGSFVPAGVTYRTVPLRTLGPGIADLLVEVGGLTRQVQLTVHATNGLAGISCGTAAVGATAECTVELLAPALTDTPVTLTPASSAVFEVPATVRVPAGLDVDRFTWRAKALGSAVLTAAAGGYTRTTSLVSYAPGVFSGFSVYGAAVVGQPVTLQASFTHAFDTDLTVSFSSSNPAVLALPASMVLPMGDTGLVVLSPALASGVTVVTATTGSSRSSAVVWVPTTNDFSVGLSGAAYEVGGADELRVQANGPLPADVVATVTAGTMGMVDVPGSLVLRAGATNVRVPVRTLKAGNTPLRVTVGAEVFGVTVRAVDAAKVATVSGTSLSVSQPGTLMVTLDAIVAKETVVTLAQAGAGALALPETVTISVGATSLALGTIGTAAGACTVTATVNGVSTNGTINVGP